MNESNENNKNYYFELPKVEEIQHTLNKPKLLYENKGKAITSMVLGIASVGLLFISLFMQSLGTGFLVSILFIGLISATLGMAFGVLNLTKDQRGTGMAITGIVTSVSTALMVLLLLMLALSLS